MSTQSAARDDRGMEHEIADRRIGRSGLPDRKPRQTAAARRTASGPYPSRRSSLSRLLARRRRRGPARFAAISLLEHEARGTAVSEGAGPWRSIPHHVARRRGRDRRPQSLHRHAKDRRRRRARTAAGHPGDRAHRRVPADRRGSGGRAGPCCWSFPAILFPPLFLADLYWWLRDSGLSLDPKAAFSSSIKPFVPQVLGVGKIAQFRTDAVARSGLLPEPVRRAGRRCSSCYVEFRKPRGQRHHRRGADAVGAAARGVVPGR